MKQSFPPTRIPRTCGDDNIGAGRGLRSPQAGWYAWVSGKVAGCEVLDVGCGLGDGMRSFEDGGAVKVVGLDIDRQLAGPEVLIGDIANIPRDSFHIVTCFDVIEHEVNDLELFGHLRRIARDYVYVTTPNFTRSGCRNEYHAREYTIAQFCNIFCPNDLWVASPDGWTHRTHLLHRTLTRWKNVQTSEIYPGGILESTRFLGVDGEEWPHYCGIFDCGGL